MKNFEALAGVPPAVPHLAGGFARQRGIKKAIAQVPAIVNSWAPLSNWAGRTEGSNPFRPAISPYANCLSGSSRGRKRPITAGFSAKLLTALCRLGGYPVSLRPFVSKAPDSAKLVRNL